MNILKNIFAILVILIFMGAAFFFLVVEGDVYDVNFGTSTSTPDSAEGVNSMDVVNKLRGRLVNLEAVKIDTDFLQSTAFMQLENNRLDPPELDGRKDNPFLIQ